MKETAELLDYVSASTPFDTQIGINPFSSSERLRYSLYPYWLKASTKRGLFFDTMNDYSIEMIPQEFALSLLYSGEARHLVACPDNPPEGPGDILTGTYTYTNYLRFHVCSLARNLNASDEACRALKSSKLEYLIWERSYGPEKPEILTQFSTLEWKSTGGQFEILRLDRPALVADFCENTSLDKGDGDVLRDNEAVSS